MALTDKERDSIAHRYRRALKGVQTGKPPQWLLDMGNLLEDRDDLAHQLNQAIDQLENQCPS